MDRETTKLTLPSGKEIELKSYLTARERNEIRDVFMEEMRASIAKEEKETDQVITGHAMIKAEKTLLETIIIALDGISEDVVSRLLDGSPEDYDFVVANANKIKAGNFKKEK